MNWKALATASKQIMGAGLTSRQETAGFRVTKKAAGSGWDLSARNRVGQVAIVVGEIGNLVLRRDEVVVVIRKALQLGDMADGTGVVPPTLRAFTLSAPVWRDWYDRTAGSATCLIVVGEMINFSARPYFVPSWSKPRPTIGDPPRLLG